MDMGQDYVKLVTLIVAFLAAGVYAQLQLPSYALKNYPLGKAFANPNQQWHFATLCLKNQSSSCTRLDYHGSLNVTSVPDYCGPCANQTLVVLKCIDRVKSHFLFTNKASTDDVRRSLHTGCSTGNFTIVPSAKSVGTKLTASFWMMLFGTWVAARV